LKQLEDQGPQPIQDQNDGISVELIASNEEECNQTLDEESRIRSHDPESAELPVEEETITVNLGTEQNSREVRISARLSPGLQEQFVAFLKEYADVFAWSYDDMVGLDAEVAVHKLPLKPGARKTKAPEVSY
jgi:hypothetical protein